MMVFGKIAILNKDVSNFITMASEQGGQAKLLNKPELPKWQRPEKTKHDLPWADIKIIDLSTFNDAGGKEKLAAELRDAVCLLPLNDIPSASMVSII